MGKKEDVASLLFTRNSAVQVYPATVKAVQERTCTVVINHTDLEVEQVKLQADEGLGLMLVPVEGSLVLVGCVENDLSNLFVCQYSELEKASLQISSTSIIINDKKVELTQGNVKVLLADNQLALSTGQDSVKTVLNDLISLLQTFVVLTAQGPSAGLDPGTITKLTQLSTKVNQVFSQ